MIGSVFLHLLQGGEQNKIQVKAITYNKVIELININQIIGLIKLNQDIKL